MRRLRLFVTIHVFDTCIDATQGETNQSLSGKNELTGVNWPLCAHPFNISYMTRRTSEGCWQPSSQCHFHYLPSLLHGVHNPEGDVDPLLLGHGVPGEAVEPVLLRGALHEEERAGEEGEADELAALLPPEFEDAHAAQRDGGDGRVAPQLWVRVRVPSAHVVAVPVQVQEG